MQFHHINHDKTRMLIFFGGFYTDYNCFEEFDSKTSDILFINDYSKMDFEELTYFDFSPYTEVNLIAYSYGVWAANRAYRKKALPEINKSVGIAGTYHPIHTLYGINPKVYMIMLNALSQQTIKNFEANMLKGSSGEIKPAERSIENLRQELISIKQHSNDILEGEDLKLDTVILTKEDRIFPYRAQEAFFENHPHKIKVSTGHFPFFEFETLDNILEQ